MPPIPPPTPAMIQAGSDKIVDICHDVVDGWELPTDAAELIWNAMAGAYTPSFSSASPSPLASPPAPTVSGSSGGSGGGPDKSMP